MVSINGIYAFKAVADEKIPAVAFPEAPPGSSCNIGAGCVGAGTGTSGSLGGVELVGVTSGTDEEKVVPVENWMPP